jgi:hypothetical protein
MAPASAFFVTVLVLQAVFVLAVLLLVGRRFPRRLRLYRFVAPAALPILLFALASYAYVSVQTGQGVPIETVPLAPITRLFLADGVLWLVGLLFGNLVIRLAGRFARR